MLPEAMQRAAGMGIGLVGVMWFQIAGEALGVLGDQTSILNDLIDRPRWRFHNLS